MGAFARQYWCDNDEPYSCGDVTIRNPFRLPGKQGCGHPIECQNNSPFITINKVNYQVLDIDYDNQTFRLIHSSLPQTERSFNCSYLSKMDRLMDVSPFHYTEANSQIAFYYNCSTFNTDGQNYFHLPCSAEGVQAYAVANDISAVYGKRCTFITRTAVLQSALDIGPTDIFTQGFELTWALTDESEHCVDNRCCSCKRKSKAPIQSVCVCSFKNASTFTAPSNPPFPTPAWLAGDDNRKENMKILKGGLLVDAIIFILICILLLVFFCCCSKNLFYSIFFFTKKSRNNHYVEVFLERFGSLAPQRFSYSDLEIMTNNFNEKLGQGGFGVVFKGKLSNGRLVAVKVLNNSRSNGKEFFSEVLTIGCTYHVNVVSLLGFCLEGSRRALIYEFVTNGSLDKFIFSDEKSLHLLGWEKMYHMLHIAINIARGLDYLHQGCNVEILHFDIKPHNILLDGEYCPKIADFGLAKLCRSEQSTISMLGARGTIGYIAPEVFNREVGAISRKSDVYSYGMMVLKMIGGRRNFYQCQHSSSRIDFSEWIHQQLDCEGDHLKQILGLTTGVEDMIVRRMAIVGLWCIQTVPSHRPSMSNVIAMLEGKVEDLLKPPLPSLFFPSCVPHVDSVGRQEETYLLTLPSPRT